MKKSNKKSIGLMVMGVLTFIGVIVGATYAYFVAQGGTTSTTGVDVKAHTTDSFSLNAGDGINLLVNQTNFSNTGGSQSKSSTATAKLVANNKTNTATRNYYLYLDITQNELQYTTTEKTPELILNVTDSSNNEVTVNGLTKVSVTDRTGATISGYNITDIGGLITIVDNKEIKVEERDTDHTTTDTYNITITMVNLDTDQSANAGKNFNATISMQKDEKTFPVLANYITSLYTTDGANGLYKHDGIGTYGAYEAGDNSYRYAGANPGNYVCFGTKAATCPTDNLYRIIGIFDGKTKLIKYDYATSDLLGTDGDYKGIGNYSSTYKGKLSTRYSYYWNKNGSNTWSESSLNKTNLNKNYLTNIGTTWASKIATETWKVGGNSWKVVTQTNAKTVYEDEIKKPATNGADGKIEDTFKVGLIYVSDFRYAADPMQKDAWSALSGFNEDATNDYRAVVNYNWLSMGEYEWTISRNSLHADRTFDVHDVGYLNNYYVSNHGYAVRPCFYLESNTVLIGGAGTQSNPYRIN